MLGDLLEEEGGTFKASSMAFGIYEDSRVIATTHSTVGAMRSSSDLSSDMFKPNSRNGRYSRLQVEGGPFRNRIASHETYYAPEVLWHAVGDGDAICELLNFYVLAVGQEANRGFGSVGPFSWEVADEDRSWIDSDGRPARVLPVKLFQDLGGDVNQYEVLMAQPYPPYRNGESIECIPPARVRRQLLSVNG